MATNQYNLQGPATQNRGCWFAIFRCFNSQPVSNKSTAPIEFENLVTAEKRASELQRHSQLVTEEEREHVMSGNYDNLLSEQERMDRERDNELRRQEEALKMEEEAYYAAKRGASRKHTSHTLTDLSSVEHDFSTGQTSSSVPGSQPLTNLPPSLTNEQSGIQSLTDDRQSGVEEMGPWTSATDESSNRSRVVTKDEEDFDKFLESVKAKQLSLTTKAPEPQPSLSDSEEEIDFGFWEKASSLPSDKTHTISQPTKELDLNLL